MTNGMDRGTFVTEAAGQVYKKTARFMYLGAIVCDNADCTVEINQRVLLANLRLRRYGLSFYDQSTASLRLKARMLKAEVMEIMLYGCVTWSPTVAHLAILRTAHRRLLLRCIGLKKNVVTTITCYPTQMSSLRLAAKTSRRRREKGGYFSRGLLLVWITKGN